LKRKRGEERKSFFTSLMRKEVVVEEEGEEVVSAVKGHGGGEMGVGGVEVEVFSGPGLGVVDVDEAEGGNGATNQMHAGGSDPAEEEESEGVLERRDVDIDMDVEEVFADGEDEGGKNHDRGQPEAGVKAVGLFFEEIEGSGGFEEFLCHRADDEDVEPAPTGIDGDDPVDQKSTGEGEEAAEEGGPEMGQSVSEGCVLLAFPGKPGQTLVFSAAAEMGFAGDGIAEAFGFVGGRGRGRTGRGKMRFVAGRVEVFAHSASRAVP
jgi:hypothetical protein